MDAEDLKDSNRYLEYGFGSGATDKRLESIKERSHDAW
jgi:hypothetical protein